MSNGLFLHIIDGHIIRIHAMMEKSTQCLAYREEAPQIESVSKRAELPKFTPEQFPECASRLPWRALVGGTGRRPLFLYKVRQVFAAPKEGILLLREAYGRLTRVVPRSFRPFTGRKGLFC